MFAFLTGKRVGIFDAQHLRLLLLSPAALLFSLMLFGKPFAAATAFVSCSEQEKTVSEIRISGRIDCFLFIIIKLL